MSPSRTLFRAMLRTLLVTLFVQAFAFNAGAAEKGTVLITGANRGIGLALAEQFTADGYQVIGTARKPANAKALLELGAQVEQLDVTDPASIKALQQRLKIQPIDILINNAGITGHNASEFSELDIEQLHTTFEVNTFGPLRVTQALLANLAMGERKLTANISSMMGSMEANTWGCCIGYRASKAALNSINKTLAVDVGKQGFTFVVLHPGYVQTDMNEGKGEYTATQSAAGLYKVISGLSHDDNGKFFDHQGKAMPW